MTGAAGAMPHKSDPSVNWTAADDLRAQVRRLWDRGDLLRNLIDGETIFPLRLRLKGPSSSEMAEHFERVRRWMADLDAMPKVRIELREVNHRILGIQRVPQSVWIDDIYSALGLIDKRREAERFSDLVAITRSQQPDLMAWLARRPLRALDLAGDWERLLAVAGWVQRHPRPGVYLRQVDIAGMHSKFIEKHRGTLAEWLDLVLPPEAIDIRSNGVGQFSARYGFLDKPARIRFRVLDRRLALLPGTRVPDITLDAESFSELNVPVRRVFITENETNFLAFPSVEGGIVIFGAGYGWEALARAQWLERCTTHYWGDIDTHGFAILDRLRSHFGHVESFLMDRSTLMAHKDFWGREQDQVLCDLPRLTSAEQALFDDLRDNRIREGLRLEQEMVNFRCIDEALLSA